MAEELLRSGYIEAYQNALSSIQSDSANANLYFNLSYYALFAGMGAGVGIAVDAMIPGKKVTIYPATPASLTAKIHVLPFCTPGRRGIAVRLVF